MKHYTPSERRELKLRVSEIFQSIDGEVNIYHQGRRAVFIRLSGCNLNCDYCDTQHENGNEMTIGEILAKVDYYKPVWKITITGGEPLIWGEGLRNLILCLRDILCGGPAISLETNGTMDFSLIPKYVNLIVDYKLKSAKASLPQNYMAKFWNLGSNDTVKFVIRDREDFEEAFAIYDQLSFNPRNPKINMILSSFAFSPVHGVLEPKELLSWMEAFKINGILNVQLHKYLGMK